MQRAFVILRLWPGWLGCISTIATFRPVLSAVRLCRRPSRARGYRTDRNLLTIAYLIAGDLKHLPASPFAAKKRSGTTVAAAT